MKAKTKPVTVCQDGEFCGKFGLHTLCPFCGKCAIYPNSMNYKNHDAHPACVRTDEWPE